MEYDLNYIMDLVFKAESLSDDPDTQVGCVLVGGSEQSFMVIDSNRHHTRLEIEEGMLVRPEKYDWIEHAERNAIFAAAKMGCKLEGSTMYIPGFPCVECARGIAESGIETLYHGSVEGWDEERYKFNKSRKILEDAGVKLIEHGMVNETEK